MIHDKHYKPETSTGMALAKLGIGTAVGMGVGYMAVQIFAAIVPPPVKFGAKVAWSVGTFGLSWMAASLAADFAEDSVEITKEVAVGLKGAFSALLRKDAPIVGEGTVSTDIPNPEEHAE